MNAFKKIFINIKNELSEYKPSIDASLQPEKKSVCRNDAAAISTYAKTLENLGMYSKALAAYQQAILQSPHDTSALKNYGGLLAKLDRYEQSLAVLRQALDIDPKDLDAQLLIMRIELSLGHSEVLAQC